MKKILNVPAKLSLTRKAILVFLVIIYLPITIVSFVWYHYSSTVSHNTIVSEIDTIANILTTQYQNKINEMYLIGDIVSGNSALLRYLEQSDSMSLFDNYVYTSTELGPFLSSINQANCNIETLRIYSFSEQITRYQNYLYPLNVLEDKSPYEDLLNLRYKEALLMPSAPLFSYQTQENQFELCYPVNVASDPYTFSLFTCLYSTVSHHPVAYLECVIQTDVLLDASNVHLDIEQLFVYENGRGVIYSQNDKDHLLGQISNLFERELLDEELRAYNVVIDENGYDLFAYPLEDPDVTLVIAYSKRDAYGQSRMECFILFFTLLFFLLFFCVCIWIFYKHIFTRLELLANRMNKLRDGDDDIVFDDLRNDAIGQVNHTLSQLLNTIYTVKLAENEAMRSFLRAQIEPHFLFNALESIRMTATLENAQKASDALIALGSLMRVRIRNRSHSTLAEELTFVNNYIQIENLRFDDRIQLLVQIENDCANVQIPTLMLQPMVENAIKHGMPQDQSPLIIKINVLILPHNSLMIRVLDNGRGIDEAYLREIQEKFKRKKNNETGTQGVALSNILQRLKLYYDDQAQLTIFSTLEVGTQITVILPITNIKPAEL